MSLQALIAHYLATNYPSVLDAFVQAARISPPDVTQPPNPDLRTLLSDWQSHQIAEDFEAVSLDPDGRQGPNLKDLVTTGLPPEEKLSGIRRTLEGITAANLLTVQVTNVPKRVFDLPSASYIASYPLSILTSSVDKALRIIDYETGEVERIFEPHRAAILTFALHPTKPRYLVTGSMDGTTVLTDLITSQALQTWKSGKFVVRVAFSPDGRFLATASYDRNVVIYEALGTVGAVDISPLDDTDDPALACEPELQFDEKYRVTVDSNPEAILFHPQSTWLMYTLRESHQLHYVSLETGQVTTKSFNPHPFDTHISFSVLNMALHPSGRIVACQTGDHRGGTGERILLYGVEPDETERLACLWTGQQGDDFVLPRMAWLPEGSGFIVTTPNGFLHLITITGETRSSIKIHGAEPGATSEVVRDCSIASVPGGWEVVSVGYDRRIRISR